MKTQRELRKRLANLRRIVKYHMKKGHVGVYGAMLAQAAEEQLLWMLDQKRKP